jgi:hypothetical protein
MYGLQKAISIILFQLDVLFIEYKEKEKTTGRSIWQILIH